MKSLLLTAALTLSSPVMADDICEGVSNLAGNIMHHRQYNNDAIQAVQLISSVDKLPDSVLRIALRTIETAYSLPHFATKEQKDVAIKEFRNGVYIGCIKRGAEQL